VQPWGTRMLMDEYWQYRFAAILSRYLPRGLAYWIGLRVADYFYFHHHQDRHAVLANLERIYAFRGIKPSKELLQGTARKTFQYFGKYLVDFFRFCELSEQKRDRFVSTEHIEYYTESKATGRGVVLVTGHFGNWELGGAVLTSYGHRIHVVFLPNRQPRLEALLRRQREKRGLYPIPLGRAAPASLKLLRAGESVALLADRDFTGKVKPTPFLGRPAAMPIGPAWLACRADSLVIPAFLIRQVDDTFLMRFHAPIDPRECAGVDDVQHRICSVLEEEIGQYPYQWFRFESFWNLDEEQSEAAEYE